MKKNHVVRAAAAFSVCLFALCLILYPDEVLDSSKNGLLIWGRNVFPALFPFFVTAELLTAFGVVRFLGVVLDPVMRPLFCVPGAGGFVWAAGFITGFPSGAKFTADLRKQGKITRAEAERLVSFTNASNPLFLGGAVAAGFFHTPELGLLLAFSHYSSNIIVGLIMRFHASHDQGTVSSSVFSFGTAFQALLDEQHKDRRPFGKKLGDAVISSVHTLLMIGGFICIFSVLYRMFQVTAVIDYLSILPAVALSLFSIGSETAVPLLSGILEITSGSRLTSSLDTVSLLEKMVVVSFILGFSGLSVHAQVAGILAETDIRYLPFLAARCLHALLAAAIAYLSFEPLYLHQTDQPVFTGPIEEPVLVSLWEHSLSASHHFGGTASVCILFFYLICLHLRKNQVRTPGHK
ncbi:sporulation integral membrane protein YlbJ [Salibacterium qingdaonense]|uniref:Sporulation integral membrane protein YlbJ n=1 Tax=Salibacterium qingdaonense TaxID=266892 RepID=A0A1I4IV88_9BACI|nr:sporulation integral membrane protein YlbJ [Salibacterium qingdaonense]SFL58289.1 sporulation integral membrane protein YlbJ [Salibacterium qingdaonense]